MAYQRTGLSRLYVIGPVDSRGCRMIPEMRRSLAATVLELTTVVILMPMPLQSGEHFQGEEPLSNDP
jgi:hypothetical protein